MTESDSAVPDPRPLLIAATSLALFAYGVLIGAGSGTATETSSAAISADMYREYERTRVERSWVDIRMLIVAAVPVTLCVIALYASRRRHAPTVLASCLLLLLVFMIITAASMGVLLLPSALLLLLAFRRSLRARRQSRILAPSDL